ncbi:CFEM-domain-containing protein, partial [Teratosphaeria nubilosa]
AVLVAAQDLSSLPQCGQTCINNMIQIATTEFGCSAGNVTCYCEQPRFGYGVRDCSNEACPSSSDANTAISYGVNYC